MSSSQNSNLLRAPTSPPPSLSQALNNERRTWTREEEDALIVILKKLVLDGWRKENAFRTGYLNVALNMLQVRFPGTDLTASKITSKLTVWKKDHYVIPEMINTSGFGWNDSSNTISVANDVWEEYVRAHPKVKSLRGKSYRYYHDWVEIFGKDRATGKNAQGPEDLAKAANQEPYIPYFDPNEFPHIHTDAILSSYSMKFKTFVTLAKYGRRTI